MPIIKVESLFYRYPESDSPVLKDISFAVDEGEFVIVTGPSGCGKTTLCRCFNGLIPHFYGGKMDGVVEVDGLQVSTTSTSELSMHVGFVFQNPENQLFSLTAEKDVAFGLENLGIPRDEMRKRVDWAMETLGISNLRDRLPQELSGGQQQKVAIASVLAMQPKIIVLDEPTSSLDPYSAKNLFEVVARLNREFRITIVLVEHRLDLAAQYADRVFLMQDGGLGIQGDPRDVFSREDVRLLGVGIPKSVLLGQTIEAEGFKLSSVPLSASEAAELLRKCVFS